MDDESYRLKFSFQFCGSRTDHGLALKFGKGSTTQSTTRIRSRYRVAIVYHFSTTEPILPLSTTKKADQHSC